MLAAGLAAKCLNSSCEAKTLTFTFTGLYARRHSDYEAWLKTDPQNPKSIWWLSDIKGIGFRVVCEAEPSETSSN